MDPRREALSKKQRTKQSPKGTCRLCGQFGELTFEHVPPARAYNEHPAIYHTLDEWENGVGGTYSPRGRGGHLLCGPCNHATGGNYGRAFVEWARQGMQLVHHLRGGKRGMHYHGVIHPLLVLKQIAVIFFDTAIQGMVGKNEDLARWVLNRESTEFPSGYRFFVFWYGGGSLRQSGVAGTLNFNSPHEPAHILAEFVHPPFGYVLVMSQGSSFTDRRPEDITWFSRYRHDEAITLHSRFPVLETHWHMPGDYRTEEQIQRHMAINDLAALGVPDPEDVLAGC